jgi:peptidyl-prolyl cis-trans isomerase B (cyclophilin B)
MFLCCKKTIAALAACVLFIALFAGCGKAKVDQFAAPQKGETVAEIVIKDYGSIYVRFFKDAAPKAVENFVTHAKDGYYDGLTFHRIIEDFMIQGGDPTGTGSGGDSIWGKDFEDEFSDALQPYRGALCMANAGPNTNGSQFFIVQSGMTFDEELLSQVEDRYGVTFDKTAKENYGEIGGTPWLYRMHTVFGQVYKGLDVLDAVAMAPKLDPENGIPATEVVIEKIIISEY